MEHPTLNGGPDRQVPAEFLRRGTLVVPGELNLASRRNHVSVRVPIASGKGAICRDKTG
ncbi:hypothetical protein THTE_3985 [Thermogutta terrifontis]|uniref:Uncharacterized protein n=1 Tax=Thermogutta terrifontis TaxID=1331910 RepID=A0A286RKU4_9BACT|nr:hypothetical protein THTE_3985 [Thermogutta terrifontis]